MSIFIIDPHQASSGFAFNFSGGDDGAHERPEEASKRPRTEELPPSLKAVQVRFSEADAERASTKQEWTPLAVEHEGEKVELRRGHVTTEVCAHGLKTASSAAAVW